MNYSELLQLAKGWSNFVSNRINICRLLLKFGTAMKVGNSREYSYYCPDKKVWEETGYFNKNM